MDSIYPAGPERVPADLTAPTPHYRRQAWIAMGMLSLFVVLYVLLAGWFGWKAWHLIAGGLSPGGNALLGIAFGLPAAFLAVFMLKALVFVKHGGASGDREITAAEQPHLFEFLYRLADEAGAPRPHRVYLSPRVNAAVFYDLSPLNLLLPSRKNLEIGLGLVNVLTLTELKAVLAHEFGHFAQRSMAVGRWVYTAQQIADHLVHKRDALDGFLRAVSNVDFRIAWVGWVLRLIVWSIRSLLETAFRGVVIAQRALSREMEMQADLVAVSLTGSDALIHALHRIHTADDALDRAWGFVHSQAENGRLCTDLFAVQQRMIEHMRTLLDDPGYGVPPPLPADDPARHRVFRAGLAQPPRMWLTHPLNHEREENAKRTYLSAPEDPRSAWTLFADPDAVRREMTRRMLGDAKGEPQPIDAMLQTLDAEYAETSLLPRYRGVYLWRSSVRWAERPEHCIDMAAGGTVDALQSLYPASLGAVLDERRQLGEELAMLEQLRDGDAVAQDGVIRHRGRELTVSDLPAAITAVREQLDAVDRRLYDHDRQCRSVHRACAVALGGGWDRYLDGLLAILHYADHSEADLRDAQRHLSNEYALAAADRTISARELTLLTAAAHTLYAPLARVFFEGPQVHLDPLLAERCGLQRWTDALEAFRLSEPTRDNLGKWLPVIDGWVGVATDALGRLRRAALQHLLVIEDRIATATIEGTAIEPAPEPSRAPAGYATLTDAQRRPRRRRLDWWSRFQTADGTFAAAARLAIAAGIVGTVVLLGTGVGRSTVIVYNGLATPVQVDVGGSRRELAPFENTAIDVDANLLHVEAHTAAGVPIERFDEHVDAGFATYVYNIASAAPLVRWSAVYGNYSEVPPESLGTMRWSTGNADVLFDDPPESISTDFGGGIRTVLEAHGDLAPHQAVELVPDPAQRAAMVAAHMRYDDTMSTRYAAWLYTAMEQDGFAALLAERLAAQPLDVALLRAEQDAAGESRSDVCARHAALAGEHAANASLQYLVARCMADGVEQDAAFMEGYRRWPDDPWWANAAAFAYSGTGQWERAATAFEIVRQRLPAFAEPAAFELFRVMRASGADVSARLPELRSSSPSLDSMLQLEQQPAYAALHAGRLADALAATADDPYAHSRMVRLAAASSGADAALQRQALALAPADGFDGGTVGATLGLLLRAGADLGPYAKPIAEVAGDGESALRAFLERVGTDPASAEQSLQRMRAGLRGEAYVAGVVALGDRAPPAWRDAADRLLLGPERPYLGDRAPDVSGVQ